MADAGRFWGLVLVGWMVACGAPDDRQGAETTRLLERLEAARVDWPDLRKPGPPVALDPTTVLEADEGVPIARVVMQGERAASGTELKPVGSSSRIALLAPQGAVYRFRISLPRSPILEVGLGYVASAEQGGRELRYRIEIEAVSGGGGLLDEVVTTSAEGSWLDRRLDLGGWAGEEVTVVLGIEGEEDGPPLWGAWSNPQISDAEERGDGWDLILISLDTLRADRLGCYGYDRPTSPYLDEFARRSIRFATAVSQSPWTRPSHRSLLTGLYPLSRQGLQSPHLAEMLWRAGYATWAVTGGGQLHYRFGFASGFEDYVIDEWLGSIPEVVKRLESRLGRRQFVFLHTFEPHDPFDHPELARGLPAGRIGASFSYRDYRSRRLKKRLSEGEKEYVRALYDGDIAHTDRQLGRLFEALDEGGVLDRAVVAITSDHGEQFWEHGNFRHGQTLYDHQLLVPLILYLPPGLRQDLAGGAGLHGAVIEQQVRLIDLYPTLLDLLDVPLTHQVQGRSLLPLLEGREPSETWAFAENTSGRVERKGLRSPRYKFVLSEGSDARPRRVELYDLQADPGERRNLSSEMPELVAALAARLQAILEGESAEREEELPTDLDPELRRQLEALGYLGN